MYAIVKKPGGSYYTSTVFAYFYKITATDDYQRYCESIHNRFYLVLNEAKTQLVKKVIFPWESKYLDPQVLIVDIDHTQWLLDENGQGCIAFLKGIDYDTDPAAIPLETLRQCIALDKQYIYHEIVDVVSDRDIENLDCAAGNFHDAFIEECEIGHGCVHVLFDGTWGCKIEMWFEDDAGCCIKSRDPDFESPYWSEATIAKSNGYYYLVDRGDMRMQDLTDNYCWFKAKRLRYRVIPNS